ncbi:MAG: DUF4416 family protein [Candidatus Omnitrophica bacterium]|nr:DUF4416 family protein [Candidatus Omnitrophota bacterium]
MGVPRIHDPVMLIAGLIGSADLFPPVRAQLAELWGPLVAQSECIPFDFTEYYAAEMGAGLQRQFLAFAARIRPEALAQIKHETNRLEQAYISGGARRINIDPGYLTVAKLVLASTKDHQHRVYIGDGMFAEVTLRFRNKSFIPWEWTYPDYRSKTAIDFFNGVRETARREQQPDV